MITAKNKLCLIIGDPVAHSLSPIIHNAGYKALTIDDDFLYAALRVYPDKIGDFIAAVRASNIRGLTITIPHKESVMPYLDKIDSVALEIGAVNTVVNDGGVLTGYNTDHIGVIKPLEELTSLKDKRVALIGAGGAAKAFAYGLTGAGAQVTIYNRTEAKAENLAKKYGCDFRSLGDLKELAKAEIICNASSVGLIGSKTESQCPIDPSVIKSGQIVFDAIYTPLKTQLIKQALLADAQVIYGSEMMLHQGFAQFEYFTNQKPPENEMRKSLMDYLHASHR